MAKTLTSLLTEKLTLPFNYRNPDIKKCPCCNGVIDRSQHAYHESRVTGEWYCDMVCLVAADEAEWVGERIKDSFGDLYTLAQYKAAMEVVSHG